MKCLLCKRNAVVIIMCEECDDTGPRCWKCYLEQLRTHEVSGRLSASETESAALPARSSVLTGASGAAAGTGDGRLRGSARAGFARVEGGQ
jgi:hypothetical protein